MHANGFAKIVLHVGGRCSVRLHVWRRRNGRWIADTMPHGHRWVFASWIVVGTLHETTFVNAVDGEVYDRFAYGRGDGGGHYLLEDGRGSLRPHRTIAHEAGTVYGRAESVIHAATPAGDGLVASLVLQGPHLFDPTPVYWPLTPAHLRALLSEVAGAVA